jgi:hypothetical protein
MPFLSYTIEVEGLSYEPLFEQVYSTSMAMLLTMVLSVYLFNVRATLQVPLFFFLVIGALSSVSVYSIFFTCWIWNHVDYCSYLHMLYPLPFTAFPRHCHLHNFPADVFYACEHACWIATSIASYFKVGTCQWCHCCLTCWSVCTVFWFKQKG